METKNYENIMSEYKDIEFRAHVDLDDVLNKVTQEAGEIIETVTNSTNTLIQDILSFSNPELTAIDMLENNKNKFISRAGKYYENIDLKDYITDVPNFPKEGIDFKDISPLLKNRESLRNMIFEMAENCRGADVIAGLDARGFLFGEAIAKLLNKPFVMIRKAGKLPGKTIGIKYGLEYGNDEIELQEGTIKKGEKVALVDDLLATGGTIQAAAELVEKAGAIVNNISFAISLDEPELQNMPARQNIGKYNINTVLNYN